jgi:hypothetical protein
VTSTLNYTSAGSGAIPATAKTPSAEFLVRDECIIDQHQQGMPIQLVVPEFDDKHFFYTATVTLKRYEQLARATSKPVDLLFGTRNDDFNLAGWYEPGGVWRFSQAFCGRDFFLGLKPMSFEQIVEALRVSGATS